MAGRRAESSYNTRLRGLAKQIDVILKGLAPDGNWSVDLTAQFKDFMDDYAVFIEPWARSVANYMIADVGRRDARMWKSNGLAMSRAMRAELQFAPTGILHAALLDEQVALIKSLPLEAAERVKELTNKGLTASTRSTTIAKEIMRTGEVTANRAKMIARTEVSRTAMTFTQARAMFAGSVGYIWRTSGDPDVRDTHQALEGKYIRWDDPPKTDKGLDPYHAGCGPNCRCYAEPVLPDL